MNFGWYLVHGTGSLVNSDVFVSWENSDTDMVVDEKFYFEPQTPHTNTQNIDIKNDSLQLHFVSDIWIFPV